MSQGKITYTVFLPEEVAVDADRIETLLDANGNVWMFRFWEGDEVVAEFMGSKVAGWAKD